MGMNDHARMMNEIKLERNKNENNMAVPIRTADMTIQKNSSILVKVEEVLADLIVVSYSSENKKFEGILLDTQKGNLPYGVYNLHPAFSKRPELSESDTDKLYSVSQRFSYQDATPASTRGGNAGRGRGVPRQKMTVRLRPRKVLCSNCQGICNENSENVDVSRKRRHGSLVANDDDVDDVDDINSKVQKKVYMGSSLIPKLSRLQPQEISNALKGNPKAKAGIKSGLNKASDTALSIGSRKKWEVAFVDMSENIDGDVKTEKNETSNANDEGISNTVFSNARTLKISFGEGEGTVLKIPAIVGDYNEDSGVSCDMTKPSKQTDSKAAKKALKRAKKQAKKNNDEKNSNDKSPKHMGALSPRNNVSLNPPSADIMQKKHKHKLKHKKKHKVPKTQVSDENTSKTADSESISYFSDIKDNCLKQKLSINLRKMSSNSYERCNNQDGTDCGSDDWESDVMPEFPATSTEGVGKKPLQVVPGDIVWGKIIGFPWWPGRVLSITHTSRAHVAWYASSTSSQIPCNSLSPFLDDYKIHFNKKKKGPYKEAVKQAMIEAKKNESQPEDPLASPTQHMSPRPINVFS